MPYDNLKQDIQNLITICSCKVNDKIIWRIDKDIRLAYLWFYVRNIDNEKYIFPELNKYLLANTAKLEIVGKKKKQFAVWLNNNGWKITEIIKGLIKLVRE